MTNKSNEDLDLSQKPNGEETTDNEEGEPKGETPTPTPPAPGEDEGKDEGKTEDNPDDSQVASLIARKNHFKEKAKTWKERAIAAGWKEDDQPEEVPTPPPAPLKTQPASLPTTDEELTAQFPSFPYLTPAEQTQLRGMVAIGKTVAEVNELIPQLRRAAAEDRFGQEFDALTTEEIYEPLIEHRDEFRKFFNSPENKGIPANLIADSFMFKHGITERQKQREDDAKNDAERQTRTGVIPPQGGPKVLPKSGEFTDAEVEAIRTSDPKKYREMLKKGIIK